MSKPGPRRSGSIPPKTQSKPADERPRPTWLSSILGDIKRPASILVVLAVGFLLYRWNLLNERLAGLLLALAVSLGALVLALLGSRGYVKTAGQSVALTLIALVWTFCAAYPIVNGIFPGEPFASGVLQEEGGSVTLAAPEGGKALYLSGRLKGNGGVVDAAYEINARWEGGARNIRGELNRNVVVGRTGRRGTTTSFTEHNQDKHYLGRTKGSVTLTLEHKEEPIESGLTVALHRAPVPPLLVLLVSIGVFLAALVLDRSLDPRGRTSFAVTAAVSLVFALYYGFDQARPNRVIAPAIGSFFLAAVAGGLGGYVIAWIVRKLTPEKKRRARA